MQGMSIPPMRLFVLNFALPLVTVLLLSGCSLPGTESSRSISKPLCTTLEAEIGEEIVTMNAKVYQRLGNVRDQANLKVTFAGLTSDGEILVLKRGRQGGFSSTRGPVDEVTDVKLEDDQWFGLRAYIPHAPILSLRVYVHDISKARLTYHLEQGYSTGIFAFWPPWRARCESFS